MSNPLVVVNSALYGAPNTAAVDVTANIQALFDLQYQANPQLLAFTIPIRPASVTINDPAPGYTKTLTIAYSIPGAAGNVFFRGGYDGQNLAPFCNALKQSRGSTGFLWQRQLGDRSYH